MQPRCRHVPPTRRSSTSATSRPAAAPYSAVAYPAGPPPRTTTSNCSARTATSFAHRSGADAVILSAESAGQPGPDRSSADRTSGPPSAGEEDLDRAGGEDRHAGERREEDERPGAHDGDPRAARIRRRYPKRRSPRYDWIRWPVGPGTPRTAPGHRSDPARKRWRSAHNASSRPLASCRPRGHLRRRPRPRRLRHHRVRLPDPGVHAASAKTEYAALNGLWILVFVVAPGFFLPLEQEVGRARSPTAASQSIGGGPVVRKAALAGRRPRPARSMVLLAVDRLRGVRRSPTGCSTAQEVLLVCFVIALGHLRGAAHHARHALGQRALRPLRHDPRRRGHLPDPARRSSLYVAGIDNLVWYGLALAIPPVLASIVVAARPARSRRARARAPSGRSSRPTSRCSAPRARSRAQALSYAAAPRRARARAGPARARRRRRLHRRVLHRPHPDPPVPGDAGRAAAEARRARRARASTPTSAPACEAASLIVVGVGVPRRASAAPPSARPSARSSSATSSTSAAATSRCCSAAAAPFILALTLAQALIALLGHGRGLIVVGGRAGPLRRRRWRSAARRPIDDLFLRVELGYLAGCLGALAVMAVRCSSAARRACPAERRACSSRPSSTSRSRSDRITAAVP